MKFRKRGLLVAASAIGAAYLASVLQKDIARYDKLAEMSGEKGLLADQIDKLKKFAAGGRNGSP